MSKKPKTEAEALELEATLVTGKALGLSRHIQTRELAARWNMSPRTLDNWRSRGVGPDFLKIGHKVMYELEAIEAFERKQRRKP